MKDRVPGAPGQYKAVITDGEQLKMAAAEPFIITLTRDDHPVTEGTPYSKAAVLPDALAASLCPGVEDPTPADAFGALHAKALESQAYPGCYYRDVEGETEWLNPPMVLGEEYRTTRRYRGAAVYEKTLNLGAMPSGTAAEPGYKWTVIGVDAGRILRWHATVRRSITDDQVKVLNGIPYVAAGAGTVTGNLYFNGNNAVLTAQANMEEVEKVNLWIEYTKEALA